MEDSEDRLLTVVNPWRQESSGPTDLPETVAKLSLEEHSATANKCWKLSWEDVCAMFDTLCLSWNPDRFPHILTHHR